MSYVDGAVPAVPTANKRKFFNYARPPVVSFALMSIVIGLGGCAANSSSSKISSTDKAQPIVLGCPNGIAKCYSTANELCGPRGFDEIERTPSSNVTTMGRLDDQSGGRHVYREDMRFEDEHQTIVIRCK